MEREGSGDGQFAGQYLVFPFLFFRLGYSGQFVERGLAD
jgi:hypothetical protein